MAELRPWQRQPNRLNRIEGPRVKLSAIATNGTTIGASGNSPKR